MPLVYEPTRDELVQAYGTMQLIREFEETIRRLHGEGKLPGFMHVSVGQEAVPTGVCLWLRDDDLMATTHRGHGDMIAKGARPEDMLAEIYARAGGLCKGKGGSMHVADASKGALGANGIVAAGLPIGVGAALSLKRQGLDRVVVCFTGDGSLVNGAAHEAFNMAALWQVPAIFVRVNNQYAESTPLADYQSMPDATRFVEGYGIPSERVDGNDVVAVAAAAGRAVERARTGDGPGYLEMETYRKYGHNIGDTGAARPTDEVERWLARDPVALLRERLIDDGVDASQLDALAHGAAERIGEAVRYAESLPEPPEEWAFEDVYSEPEIAAALGLR